MAKEDESKSAKVEEDRLKAEEVSHAVPPVVVNQLLTTKTATSSDVIRQQVTSQDYLVLRYAVVGLILAISISMLGVIFLAWNDKTLPDGIIAIGSAAVGALATMLVRPPIDK